jgi:hypothetical protein
VLPAAEEDGRGLTLPSRLTVAGLGALLLALLATAAVLRPDPRGYGTHQRLGLPPCSFQRFVGLRCPSCGMTTAWSHWMRGEIGKSINSSVAGAVLAVMATISAPWMLACGLRGKWIGGRPRQKWALALAMSVVVVAIVDWIVRLRR